MKLFYALSICLLSAGASYAAPPPPEILPAKFPKEIEGYDVGNIYSIFTRKLERSYADALYRRAKFVENYKGPRIIFNGDWGRGSELYQFSRNCEDDCIWAYHSLKLDSNYFRELASQEFNPNKFVEDLRRANMLPDDLWKYGFRIDESIIQKLIQNVSIKSLTQSECPAILESLAVLEGLKVPSIDVEGVGKDRKGSVAITHSTWVEIEIPKLERNTSVIGEIKISGYGSDSYAGQLSKKVFKPMQDCFNN